MLDANNPIVSLSDCSVSYGKFRALSNINLTICEGESIAIVGPSGSGKTSLLQLIAKSTKFTGNRKVQGRIGLVYQDLKLLPWMTVQENILLAKNVRNHKNNELNTVIKLLELADIGDKATNYPYQLSGGQQQRVAVLRALYTEPDLLLVDEPFSALDFVAKERLISVIQKIQKSYSVAFVVVTHDLNDAMLLADRILILREGGIIKDIKAKGGLFPFDKAEIMRMFLEK
jgi:ABC-type nitrate/sulfonate/bicarbonate transport system ATPase subunit